MELYFLHCPWHNFCLFPSNSEIIMQIAFTCPTFWQLSISRNFTSFQDEKSSSTHTHCWNCNRIKYSSEKSKTKKEFRDNMNFLKERIKAMTMAMAVVVVVVVATTSQILLKFDINSQDTFE